MKVDNPILIEDYRNRSYAVHCQPSNDKAGKWSVWVEIFNGNSSGQGDSAELLMSAEHQYIFPSYEEGKHAGVRLAEQMIDVED